jgi:hypothetical protein
VPEPNDHVPSYDAKDIGMTIEMQKERYLLKTTIQMALRSLYGDGPTPSSCASQIRWQRSYSGGTLHCGEHE